MIDPLGLTGVGTPDLRGLFFEVPDGNSKIATVTPVQSLSCTPSLTMGSIALAVWPVGGVLDILDFGPSPYNSSLSVSIK